MTTRVAVRGGTDERLTVGLSGAAVGASGAVCTRAMVGIDVELELVRAMVGLLRTAMSCFSRTSGAGSVSWEVVEGNIRLDCPVSGVSDRDVLIVRGLLTRSVPFVACVYRCWE